MACQFAPPPPSLTVGEAQDLGPRIVRAKSLVPLRDTLAEIVSRNRFVHRPVERPEDPAPIQVAEPAAAESVNSSRVESDPGEDEIVTRRAMTIDRFVSGTCPTTQQQEPQRRNPTPPPLPPDRSRKRQCTVEQPAAARGMHLQELPPECLGGSLFVSLVAMFSPLHRLGLTSCLFRGKRWVGRPLSGSAVNPLLCQSLV